MSSHAAMKAEERSLWPSAIRGSGGGGAPSFNGTKRSRDSRYDEQLANRPGSARSDASSGSRVRHSSPVRFRVVSSPERRRGRGRPASPDQSINRRLQQGRIEENRHRGGNRPATSGGQRDINRDQLHSFPQAPARAGRKSHQDSQRNPAKRTKTADVKLNGDVNLHNVVRSALVLPRHRKEVNDTAPAAKLSSAAGKAAVSTAEKGWKTFGVWKLECSSTNGRGYYYNIKTKKSTWYKPQEWIDAENAATVEIQSPPPTVEKSSVAASGKRKLSAVEISDKSDHTKSSKIPRTVVPLENALLGSPISDDNDERSSAASPTPSERMDISDAEAASNASVAASKNAATMSSQTSASRVRKTSDDLTASSSRKKPQASQTKRTKAPTMEDLKKLEENDDPDKRRSLKLERVKEWRSQLGGTPTEVSQSPVVDISGSPVSSETSTVSPQWPRTTSGSRPDVTEPTKTESPVVDLITSDAQSGRAHIASSSACSRIVLPTFDFPDLPEFPRDIPHLFLEPLTTGFSSMKIIHVEDQKCKHLYEVRPGMYSASGQRVVQMKSNLSDIRQKKMTTLSQAEDISFLSSLQDELSRSMHSRSDVPKPYSGVKLESADLNLKSDISTYLVDSKPHLIRVATEDRRLLATPNGLTT